jgi:FMN-dependent NADH-azoreductase
MRNLLAIHASGRRSRSVTRHLATRFADTWRTQHPDASVVVRDVGVSSPSPVDERWIEAAFDDSREPKEALGESEALIEELVAADAIVLAVPMYNLGLPAQAKAYFDQVIRIGRTFVIGSGADFPYRSLLSPKPCTIITSVSDPALYPDGALAHLNFLEPHLSRLWGFVGVRNLLYVRAEEALLQDPQRLARLEAVIDDAARRAWAWDPDVVWNEGAGAPKGQASYQR